jgi:hypothetical protein
LIASRTAVPAASLAIAAVVIVVVVPPTVTSKDSVPPV